MVLELKNNYGHLFEDALINEILEVGTFKEVPEGFKLMEIGSYIRSMPLLVSSEEMIIDFAFKIKAKLANTNMLQITLV